jgi:hypothetical protein
MTCAAKYDEQMAERSPNHVDRRRAWRGTLAARKVTAQEVVDERLVHVCQRSPRPAEPTGEVLHPLHVLVDRRRRVTALDEVRDEVIERRAQPTASQSARDARRAENFFDHDRFLPGQEPEGSDSDYAALFKPPMGNSSWRGTSLRIIENPA